MYLLSKLDGQVSWWKEALNLFSFSFRVSWSDWHWCCLFSSGATSLRLKTHKHKNTPETKRGRICGNVARVSLNVEARHQRAQRAMRVGRHHARRTQTSSTAMERGHFRRSRRVEAQQNRAKLLNKIESERRLPKSAEIVPIVCLSHIGKRVVKAGEVRPIALLQIICNIWSSVRYEQMETWSREWSHKLALGSKNRTSIQRAVWPVLLELDKTHTHGKSLTTTSTLQAMVRNETVHFSVGKNW